MGPERLGPTPSLINLRGMFNAQYCVQRMITKKLPVVVYEGGNRKVIGQAVVEVDGDYISLDARVNLEHAIWKGDDMHFSLGPFVAPKDKKEQ